MKSERSLKIFRVRVEECDQRGMSPVGDTIQHGNYTRNAALIDGMEKFLELYKKGENCKLILDLSSGREISIGPELESENGEKIFWAEVWPR